MHLGPLIEHYGYAAIVLGTFFEGETALILGGIAAHLGYLSLPGVIIAAFTGAIIGDESFFFLGRQNGHAWLARRPTWRRRAQRAMDLLHRHRIPMILGFRFVYGIRAVTPFVLGMSRIPVPQFIALNLVSAGVWASAVGVVGYWFGGAVQPYLGEIRKYEYRVLAALLTLAVLFALFRMYRTWRRR